MVAKSTWANQESELKLRCFLIENSKLNVRIVRLACQFDLPSPQKEGLRFVAVFCFPATVYTCTLI